MWAQLIKGRIKPGNEDRLSALAQQFKDAEQPESGLRRSLTMLNQNDRGEIYMMIVMESEEKARIREKDPRREPGMAAARATMAEIFEGDFQFTDLDVVEDVGF